MLDADHAFPVIWPLAETTQQVVVVLGGLRVALAEVGVADAAALAVDLQVPEVAIRIEITVSISPRPSGADDRRHDRIIHVRQSRCLAFDLPVHTRFDGRLAVAEHIGTRLRSAARRRSSWGRRAPRRTRAPDELDFGSALSRHVGVQVMYLKPRFIVSRLKVD